MGRMAAKPCSACSVLISLAEDGDEEASKGRTQQAMITKPAINMLLRTARVVALIVAPDLNLGLRFKLQKNWFNSCHSAEIRLGAVKLGAVAQAGILVGPVYELLLHLAVDGDKPVRPERNTAFIQPLLHLLARRLEDGGPRDHHLKFSLHPAQASQNALAHFADELDGKTAGLAFGGDAVFGKSGRAKVAGQRRRTGAVADDFDFLRRLVQVLQVAVVDGLFAQLGKQIHRE